MATKEKYKKLKDQYTAEKSSTVWSSSYTQEAHEKYQQQHKEYENEQQEREAIQSKPEATESLLDGTPIVKRFQFSPSILGTRGDFSFVKLAKEISTGQEYAIKETSSIYFISKSPLDY